MYFTRKLEDSFLKYNKEYKVLLLTGQRQSGKTTMLEHLIKKSLTSKIKSREIFMKGIDYSYYYELED